MQMTTVKSHKTQILNSQGIWFGSLFKDFFFFLLVVGVGLSFLKGSYDAILKIIILCGVTEYVDML